ncbi:PREDICTED: protein SMG8 isoform X2 [Nicrophorus vespilloides]|uniref:Nonsense-mediated mRNA decay factor SMG8 n=1 Tax=Nicrophorus vespilloides TaxID=110193 RepID=A0ABM1NBU5_NICVS|nr:PREDICTED: protein SMG8 isoform X2 [Nicrophorus vespilloides]
MKMKESFLFPDCDFLLENASTEQNEKIVVVSIIGKTAYNSKGLKLKALGRMFTSPDKRTNECTIEGYYDEKHQIIYLHVHSLLDTDNFIKNYSSLEEKCDMSNDFLTIFDQVKSSYAKTMFTLFYISHIVIISQPSYTFDTNYIQYFKAMESMDQKLLENISSALREVACLGENWIIAGRPATPRVIFYFERCPKSVTNIKKYEHNIEDRIYYILRKTRIISYNKAWSLFAIPLNEEFVFVSSDGPPDRLGEAVRGLVKGCQPDGAIQIQAPYCSQSDNPRNFQNFLRKHIKQARSKGFEDVQAHFELPSLLEWVKASKAIHGVMEKLGSISELSTETRFSEQRCLKVLPLAVARYQEALTGRYTSTVHETRLGFAMALFGAQARGPMFHKFSKQLEAECVAFWKNGKQLCEKLSLTGNPCTQRKEHGEDVEHSSGVKYVAVCDCGRKQGSRDDPYNAKDANYTFYYVLSKECGCLKSERLPFPIFKPSGSDYKVAVLDSEETLSDNNSEATDGKMLVKQSTTEYLPGMLTTVSPRNLLPEYSSWSLVCLGPSSLYSHNLGLSDNYYPGFWATTNYLLPWDVLVYSKAMHPVTLEEQLDQTKWSNKRREVKPTKWVPQFAVKLFIGFEYECPRGHRFMLAAPDKILKAAPGSIVKDKGQKVAESDMPMYFPCLCTRGVKNMIAQLMRIHVVTPKAAVNVKLNPRVQPAAGAPIFVPTLDGPSTLTQAAYWILRLPYIYYSDKKNFLENQNARLLSGVFSVKKMDFN